MKKHTYFQYVMNSFIFLILAGSLIYSIFLSLYFPLNVLQTLGMSFSVYILLSIILYNRRNFLFSLFLAFLTLWFYSWFLPKNWWEDLFTWMEWIILYIQGLVPLNPIFIRPTSWLIVFITSIVFFIFTFKIKKMLFVLWLGILILGAEWFLGHEQILPCMWMFALSLIMLLSSRHHYSLSKNTSVPDYGLWMLWTLPTALIIILIAFISVPQDTSIFKWQFLEDKISSIQERWSQRFEFTAPRQPFRLSETGFSPTPGELGGPVKLSDDVVLEVKSPQLLYLRGTILNEYTGSNWLNSVEDKRYKFPDLYWEQVRHSSYDWDEQIWKDLDSSHIDRFFPSIKAVISHVGIETSVLFNSIRCYDIAPLKKHSYTPYFNQKSETFTSQFVPKEIPYTLDIRTPAMDDTEFQQFVIEYVSSSDMKQFYEFSLDLDKSSRTKHETIIENYTYIPDTVPPRVYQLADSITQNVSSPFEKAQALEDYLKENFIYTLNPPYTPQGKDFVDYFLFDLKKGYCTYFASAMAIMGRCINLPTRYVEGFSMPQQPSKEDIYEVRKEHGHAWVEIYFPKIGWLPFDPTPAREIHERERINNPSDYYPYYEEYMDNQFLSSNDIPELNTNASSNKGTTNSWWNRILSELMWLLILLLLIMVLPVSILLWYRLKKHKTKKYPLNTQLLLYYKEILWLLKLYQFPIQPGETPYKYSKRVDTWLVNPAASMSEIAHIVVKTQFGAYSLSKQDLNIVRQFYIHLEKDIIKLIGFPWYLVKFVLRHLNLKWGFLYKQG